MLLRQLRSAVSSTQSPWRGGEGCCSRKEARASVISIIALGGQLGRVGSRNGVGLLAK